MKTVIKPVPDDFDREVSLEVFEDARAPGRFLVAARHPAREGVVIRKPFEAPRGMTFREVQNVNLWRAELPLSWEHIVTALWVSGSDAYETVETFENAPTMLGELRADKSGSAADWSPREALIELLRRVDSGEYPHMDTLVLCWRTSTPKPNSKGREISSYYSAASPDIHTTLGVLLRAEYVIQESATEE